MLVDADFNRWWIHGISVVHDVHAVRVVCLSNQDFLRHVKRQKVLIFSSYLCLLSHSLNLSLQGGAVDIKVCLNLCYFFVFLIVFRCDTDFCSCMRSVKSWHFSKTTLELIDFVWVDVFKATLVVNAILEDYLTKILITRTNLYVGLLNVHWIEQPLLVKRLNLDDVVFCYLDWWTIV